MSVAGGTELLTMEYESEKTVEARSVEGVRYTIARMSFGRRLELTRRIWELAGKAEFVQAGGRERDKLEAALLAGEIDRIYLAWGLVRIEGLTVDGAEATPAGLFEAGPEELTREVVAAIKAECGLSEEEKKT